MPRYNNPRKTWRYSNEFKVKAVQLSRLDSVQAMDVAKTLDIHPFMLSRWRKEYREGIIVADQRRKVTALSPDLNALSKLKPLENENTRLKQENALLKSGNGISRKHIRAIWIHPEIPPGIRNSVFV